jgi:hypothetical protein
VQFPDEGGPVIRVIDIPEDIVARAVNDWFPFAQGLMQFDQGSGLEELVAAANQIRLSGHAGSDCDMVPNSRFGVTPGRTNWRPPGDRSRKRNDGSRRYRGLEYEKCRAPFSVEDLFGITRRGSVRPDVTDLLSCGRHGTEMPPQTTTSAWRRMSLIDACG